jgi:hypothetical protein
MKSKFLVVALFGFCGSFLLAQTGDTVSTISPRSWAKVTYRFKPAKKLNIDLSALYRDVGGEEGKNSFISEVQFNVEQSKTTTIAIELRHYSIFDVDGLNQRWRARVSATKSLDIGKDDFSIRLGAQHREIISGGGAARADARFRASYTKSIKNWKWDPTVYSEYIGSFYSEKPDKQSRRLRLGVETDNKVIGGKLSVGYFYQHDFTESATHYNTISVGYRF